MKTMMTAAACVWALLAASGASAQDRYDGTAPAGMANVSYTLLFKTGFSGAVSAKDLLSGSTFTFADPVSPITYTYDQSTNGTTVDDGKSPGYVFYAQGVTVGGGSVTFDFSDANATFGVADRATGGQSYFFCAAGNFNNCGVEAGFGGVLIASPNAVGLTPASGKAVIATAAITAATAAVPEPASWAMMIAGAGLVGTALRVRRRRVTFAAA